MPNHRTAPSIRRAAAAISRRTSLITLGGVALAGAAMPLPSAAARKNKDKKQARKRCKKQVAACREVFTPVCQGSPTCEEFLLPCCSLLADCQAAEAVTCVLAWFGQ